VEPAYDAGPWADFAAGMAGSAAALAGLLFVAVSINIRTILGDPRITRRAAQALVLLALPVFISLALLIPGQPEVALAIELLVMSAVTVPGLGLLAFGARAPEQPRSAWIVTSAVPSTVVAVAPLIAAIGLLTESLGGLYWLPTAVALALASGLVNAWVLLVEILR
jgi:modulator of FtsH protease